MALRFDSFTLDTDCLELRAGSDIVSMEQKNFDLLALLIKNRARIVSKEEIFAAIWPNVLVTDASLSTAIGQIRKALGDTGSQQNIIKTIRGRGFRFVADVKSDDGVQSAGESQYAAHDAMATPLAADRPVIVVLPFDGVDADSSKSAIQEAIPAELIATLSRLRWIKVIARGSSFNLGVDSRSPSQIRRTLGADYVLSGVIELSKDLFSSTVELTDARSSELIWCETFASKLDDIFETREQIARQTVSAMELSVPSHEADLLSHIPSDDLTAWGHYHLGVRHMQTYSHKNNRIAERHFAKAVALDPGFARAHAALSYTEFQNHFQMYGHDIDQHRNQCMRHAERAIEIDAIDPFCNLNMGRAKWLFDEVDDGLLWTERALKANPNYAFGYYNNAMLHSVLCEGDLAEIRIREALDLSPLDPHLQSMLGIRALAAHLRGKDTDAVVYASQALNAPNPHLYVYMIAAIVFLTAGKAARAKNCVELIKARNSTFSSREFLQHYNLRDPSSKTHLRETLQQLGI